MNPEPYKPLLHIVLYQPEIPPNTGNIIRLCANTGASLHLVGPLGFQLDNTRLKRAGLDYWQNVKLSVWDDFIGFKKKMIIKKDEIALFTKNGEKPFWSLPNKKRLFLVFGSETRGLPEDIIFTYQDTTYCIPISNEIRSLNLSTTVGIALYESLRPNIS